jgi:hypothetical protein
MRVDEAAAISVPSEDGFDRSIRRQPAACACQGSVGLRPARMRCAPPAVVAAEPLAAVVVAPAASRQQAVRAPA